MHSHNCEYVAFSSWQCSGGDLHVQTQLSANVILLRAEVWKLGTCIAMRIYVLAVYVLCVIVVMVLVLKYLVTIFEVK